MDDVDAVVIGSGPNGLVAADPAGPRRVAGDGPGAIGGGRRRRAQRRAHRARLRPRHLLRLLRPPALLAGAARARPRQRRGVGALRRRRWPPRCRPRTWRCVTATPSAPRPGWRAGADGDGPAWTSLYRWWREVGTAFLARCSAPWAHRGPGSPLPAGPGATASSTPPRMLLGPLEALCTERFSRPRRPGPGGGGGLARRCARRPPRQRAGRPHPRHGRPGARDARARRRRRSARRRAGPGRHRRRRGDRHRRRGHAGRGGAQPRRRGRDGGREPCLGPGGPCSPTPVPGPCSTGSWAPTTSRRAISTGSAASGTARACSRSTSPSTAPPRGRDPSWPRPVWSISPAISTPWPRPRTRPGGASCPRRPMLIVGQQTVADPSRAPAGGHTLWIETHVPPVPRLERVVGVVERRLSRRRHGPARGPCPGPRVQGRGQRGAHPRGPRAGEPQPGGRRPRGGLELRSTSSSCSGPCRGGSATAPRSRASTCARPRRTPGAASTAWPGTTAPGGCCRIGAGAGSDRARHPGHLDRTGRHTGWHPHVTGGAHP